MFVERGQGVAVNYHENALWWEELDRCFESCADDFAAFAARARQGQLLGIWGLHLVLRGEKRSLCGRGRGVVRRHMYSKKIGLWDS